jgi:glucose dehydrogenase
MRSSVTSTRAFAASVAAALTVVTPHALTVHAQPAAVETSSLPPRQRGLPRAPAFRARELTQLPRAGWNTNGGTLDNQRYSPLTQINRDNVANLRAEWRASLGGSGMGPPRGPAASAITVPQNRVADLAHGRELYTQTCTRATAATGRAESTVCRSRRRSSRSRSS